MRKEPQVSNRNEKATLRYFEIAFPGQSEAIAARRSADTVFDEICRDFDEIAAVLTELKSTNAGDSTDQIKDLTVSLEGLHEEIAEYLQPRV
jgi:hypothetical protein